MGKQALTVALEDILKETEKYREGVVDTYEHVYPVNASKVAVQVKKAIHSVDPNINTDRVVIKEVKVYTKELYDRFKRLEGSSRVKTVTYKVVGNSDNFVVRCMSKPGMSTDVFSKINEVRTSSLGKEPFIKPKNWNKLTSAEQNKLKDIFNKNSSMSPLSKLRQRILLNLFNIELEGLDLTKDDKTLDTILGARQYSKDTNEFIGRRGGLLHLGHLDGFAVIERRAAAIISTIKERTGIEIGKATISKSIRNRRKFNLSGDFAEISLDLDLENLTTIVEDEFAGLNISKVFEKNILPQIRKAFLARKNWHKYPGSVSVEQALSEDGSQDLMDTIQKGFKSSKLTRTKTSGKGRVSKSKAKSIKLTGTKTKTKGEGENFNQSSGPSKKDREPANPISTYNWSSILKIVNSKLPLKVIANMGTPSLVNRTGRFAQSAEVVRIEETREGFPSFVFNYERDPYDVFDRTLGRAPWNTPQRDPRALVDKSVREIVREMAISRFYTRRA
jgi:hypothetical protein